jgi:hypothetical protein
MPSGVIAFERARALPVDGGTLRTLDEAARAINELRGAKLKPASALTRQ